MDIIGQIQKDIAENKIVLYMKGTADQPLCGFSAYVVTVLNQHNLPFKAVNVLASDALRQGIKDFTNWPTLPQLYILGEFIGGCDIVREMVSTGAWEALLREKGLAAS